MCADDDEVASVWNKYILVGATPNDTFINKGDPIVPLPPHPTPASFSLCPVSPLSLDGIESNSKMDILS